MDEDIVVKITTDLDECNKMIRYGKAYLSRYLGPRVEYFENVVLDALMYCCAKFNGKSPFTYYYRRKLYCSMLDALESEQKYGMLLDDYKNGKMVSTGKKKSTGCAYDEENN